MIDSQKKYISQDW